MIKKIGNILEKHKYAISVFVFFVVYNFVVIGNFSFPAIDKFGYTLYLADYSIGFCPLLLPGAIYNALFSTTQADVVNVYVNVIYHLFLLAVSFMLEKFLYKFDSKNRFFAFIIVLFFITGPSTFSIHVYEIGLPDTYWLFFTVILLITVQNKYLKWFVPIVFVLSIFIHLGALITFIPFFALIILLEASQNEKISKSYMSIFTISVLLAVLTFLYFIMFGEKNLTLSIDSLRTLISERNISDWQAWPDYFEYALYRRIPDNYSYSMEDFTPEGSSFLVQIFSTLLQQIKLTFSVLPEISPKYFVDFAKNVIISMPVIIILYKFVLSFFKKEKDNKLRRFVWFCALCLIPFVLVTTALCSPDFNKWFGHGVICLFALVMYELYRTSDNNCLELMNKIINEFSCPAVIIYFVFYMTCIVNPLS